MESADAYFDRKFEELKLLNSCLGRTIFPGSSNSVADVIRRKFQMTAALRAAHEMKEWNATETAWPPARVHSAGLSDFNTIIKAGTWPWKDRHSMRSMSGTFDKRSMRHGGDYFVVPRALQVDERCGGRCAASLLRGNVRADRRLCSSIAPGVVSIESSRQTTALAWSCGWIYASHLGISSSIAEICISTLFHRHFRSNRAGGPVVRGPGYSADPGQKSQQTGFIGGGGRRLGSITLIRNDFVTQRVPLSCLEELMTETRNAIRLLGNAALPAHCPSFVATSSYRRLTRPRMASILRNGLFLRHFEAARRAVPVKARSRTLRHVWISRTSRRDVSTAGRRRHEQGAKRSRVSHPSRWKFRIRFRGDGMVPRLDDRSLPRRHSRARSGLASLEGSDRSDRQLVAWFNRQIPASDDLNICRKSFLRAFGTRSVSRQDASSLLSQRLRPLSQSQRATSSEPTAGEVQAATSKARPKPRRALTRLGQRAARAVYTAFVCSVVVAYRAVEATRASGDAPSFDQLRQAASHCGREAFGGDITQVVLGRRGFVRRPAAGTSRRAGTSVSTFRKDRGIFLPGDSPCGGRTRRECRGGPKRRTFDSYRARHSLDSGRCR